MSLSDGEYTCTYELEHGDAGYFGYHFEITTDGETYETDQVNVVLKTDSANGDSGGDGSSNGSPGFELIAVLISIFVGVFLLKRKRSR